MNTLLMVKRYCWGFVLCALIALIPASVAKAGSQGNLVVVARDWKYVYDPNSAFPHRVELTVEVKNTSGQYFKNVAVRTTLRTASGLEIKSQTAAPIKIVLAPNESSFLGDTIYDNNAFLTAAVEMLPFGDPASPSDYPYLPDPQPIYLSSSISGGYITYFGEIVNLSGYTWRTSCTYCNAPYLIGVYYEGSRIAGYSSLATAPNGHLPLRGKVAFRFTFERVPGGSFKLFSRVFPMNPGDYATTWGVENFSWEIVRSPLGGKEAHIVARIRNLSDVSAEPEVWMVARGSDGKWIGWTSCFIFGNLLPNETKDCDERISSANMHVGIPEDIRSIEVLYASSAITHQAPPTPPYTVVYLPLVRR